MERMFRIVITKDEEGMYVAECLDLPGCVSQGKTEEKSLKNIRDAIKGYIASLKKHGEPLPPIKELHIAEIAV